MKGLAAVAASLALAAPAAPSRASRPPVRVDAEEIQVLYKENRAVFVGKPLVRLTREDAVLTCHRLVADNDAAGRIRRAVCTGDVRLTRGERLATCEVATFEASAGTVVCRGKPELRDGRSVLRGEVLTYHLDEDKAVLSQATGTVTPRPGEEPVPARKQGGAR